MGEFIVPGSSLDKLTGNLFSHSRHIHAGLYLEILWCWVLWHRGGGGGGGEDTPLVTMKQQILNRSGVLGLQLAYSIKCMK